MAPDLEAAVREAWDRFRGGDRQGGLAAVAQLAAAHPEEPAVLGAHAALLWAAGDRAAAAAQARAAVEGDPGEAGALTVLGQAALHTHRAREAERHLAAAYRVAPSTRRAALWARALREAGDLDEAARVVAGERGRTAQAGRSVLLSREEALVAEARGDVARASELWTGLLDDPGEGAFARGRLLRLRTRDLPAAEAARALAEAARARATSDPRAGAEILLAAADRQREGGDLEGAAQAYRTFLADRPGDPYALRQLAFVLRRQGHADQARPLLETLLATDPTDTFVRSALTADYLAAGEAEAGIAFVRGLVAEHPQAKVLYGMLRRLRAGGAGREEAARSLRRRGRRVGPDGDRDEGGA